VPALAEFENTEIIDFQIIIYSKASLRRLSLNKLAPSVLLATKVGLIPKEILKRGGILSHVV
jgi:hypothetical protein